MSTPTIWKGRCTGIGCSGGRLVFPPPVTIVHSEILGEVVHIGKHPLPPPVSGESVEQLASGEVGSNMAAMVLFQHSLP